MHAYCIMTTHFHLLVRSSDEGLSRAMGRVLNNYVRWFKVRGATVYPSEVESALRAIPGVAAAHVVDVARGSATAVAAAIVPAGGSPLTVDDLEREARARLSAFKVPTRWHLLAPDGVPTTSTGKVDKDALQQLFE